ncbi:MAG: Tex-like N-terminal domain-containing protein, partial [Chloroflexota bacterium]
MTDRQYDLRIARQLNLQPEQVGAAISLLDSGNTIPFIARYRKEATRSLDEEQLRQLASLLERLRAVDDRRDAIVASIAEQGKLTPELQQKLEAAETLTELEDLYQPFKPKRRTRAGIARERGLQPLADLILQQARPRESAEQIASAYLGDDVPTPDDALAGARDIVAETISDDADVRRRVRDKALRFGLIVSEKIKDAQDERGVFELYYDFQMRVDRLKPYQALALNRGEAEKVLRLRVEIAERDWREPVEARFRVEPRSPFAPHLRAAIDDAAARLLLPAIERDVRRTLTEPAE